MLRKHRRVGEFCSRVVASSRAELWDRARQEIWKRLDLASYYLGRQSQSEVSRIIPDNGPRFFFDRDQVSGLTRLLQERLPEEAKQIVLRAERICAHRFDLLGYSDLVYEPEIDWHVDRVHNKRAPRKPWYKIRYLDFHEVGDVKITWELNRHQHLVTLAKAYRISGRGDFAREALAQWYQWLSQNPYPIGVNWASSLEVAFRSLSWLWMRFLLDGSELVPESFRLDLLQALAINGRHMERYLSTYFSPNTHLLGEGVALFFIGTLCPELERASRWQKLGWKIVLQQAQRQVHTDGMHFEKSTYYHIYALDFFLHAELLAARNDIPIPSSFERTIERMAEALCALGQARVLPRFGDDDGGRLFDPHRNRVEHLLDPLATAAASFRRGDFKSVVGELPEEAFWLLGPNGVSQFDRLASAPGACASVALPESGFYIMASSQPQPQLLVIDCGLQSEQCSGHRHADALSIQLIVNGHALLVDPGTCEYVGDGPERNLFRGTAAHNTLRIDCVDQSEPEGPFSWASHAPSRVERWISEKTFDFLVASHDHYLRFPGAPLHRRSVFHRKSQFWLVRDRVEGTGKHPLELSWHIAPDLIQRPDQNQRFIRSEDSLGLGIVPQQNDGWAQIMSKEFWSPVYGRKEMGPVLRLQREVTLPAEIVTLLVPLFGVHSDLGVLWRSNSGEAGPVIYRYKVGNEEHSFFFATGKPWNFDGWSSDAEFLYCQSDSDLKEIVFCKGSYVEFAGQRVVSAEQRVSAELVQSGATAKILGAAESLTLHSWPQSFRQTSRSIFETAPIVSETSD